MNYRLVLRVLGVLLLPLAGSMVLCLPWAWLDRDYGSLAAISLSLLAGLILGGFLMLAGRGTGNDVLGRREGLLVVTGGWLLAGAFGALPFILSGAISQPVDALFESISGLTTTGASILTDIESMPRALLFWRSQLQWLGGMGIIVLFVAVLPSLGIGGRFLYRHEAPGPSKAGLLPHVRDTASLLWKIYVGFSAIEVMALTLAGVDLFEAICHTFSTMATGGYSTRNASVAGFESFTVEMILAFFMLAAGINFALFARLGRTNRPRGRRATLRGLMETFQDPELRLYLGIIGIAIAILAGSLIGQAGTDPATALRQATFQAISIQSTTGFGSADFDGWPPVCRLLLVLLMFVGGCAGSTGGSMKVVRHLVMGKMAMVQLRRFFRPRRVASVSVGDRVIGEEMQQAITGFFVLFFSTWIVLSLALTAMGTDFVTAITAAIACLGNIGPGLDQVGATQNYAFFSAPAKLLLALSMIIGRLEIYTVLGLLSRSFWRP